VKEKLANKAQQRRQRAACQTSAPQGKHFARESSSDAGVEDEGSSSNELRALAQVCAASGEENAVELRKQLSCAWDTSKAVFMARGDGLTELLEGLRKVDGNNATAGAFYVLDI
jgi:hypothetical protein